LRQRLFGATAPAASDAVADSGWVERVARVAQPFSKLSLPEEGWERSPLRTRFMNAGWRQASAPALYFAAKSVLVPAVSHRAGAVRGQRHGGADAQRAAVAAMRQRHRRLLPANLVLASTAKRASATSLKISPMRSTC